MTLWAGRLPGGMAPAMAELTTGLEVDRQLWREDLRASGAHVEGLARAGLLRDDEAAALLAALETVGEELAAGTFAFAASDEDVHTAVERRVTELAGPTGEKLHTARSRNDQVATDLRLWCKAASGSLVAALLDLVATLEARAAAAGDAALPGYTHLQRAQPVTLAHHLRAHAWALLRDVDRLCDAAARLDVSPLGAGALAGTSLPIDPSFTARRLGFARAFANSLDAVSDRDFVAELCFCCTLAAVHCSRMGEELVVWSSTEFGFVELDDAYSTGSSMLPHKKNPDAAELARGKAGRLIGNLAGLLATLKGLPLAYNRDLQEDKAPLFDSVGELLRVLLALEGCYATAAFRTEAMAAAAADDQLAAVGLAEALVRQGMPFREAHRRVGALAAVDGGAGLLELAARDPELAGAAAACAAASATAGSPGGAGPAAAEVQAAALAAALQVARGRAGALPRLDRAP